VHQLDLQAIKNLEMMVVEEREDEAVEGNSLG
jgi:hypothetical protein